MRIIIASARMGALTAVVEAHQAGIEVAETQVNFNVQIARRPTVESDYIAKADHVRA